MECFVENNKSPNYKEIVANMVENDKKLGCNMSDKLHFLDSHVDYFPEILGARKKVPSIYKGDGGTLPRKIRYYNDG
ncbi:unnamed protein product [Diabrotica balteata]|uniref:Uncharacterized protein n=1 Tax=Diabrotica balteata TaxID=107213 RepID=A0A9N9SUJ7_DIABA|nr:unnamed protein product [Diabrotica balteata]